MARMADDVNVQVREAIAERPDLPPALMERMASRPDDEDVRCGIAQHPNLPLALMDQLAADEWWEVRLAIAQRPDLPLALAERMSSDSDEEVAARAADRLAALAAAHDPVQAAETHPAPGM
jgi:hypothetical protein